MSSRRETRQRSVPPARAESPEPENASHARCSCYDTVIYGRLFQVMMIVFSASFLAFFLIILLFFEEAWSWFLLVVALIFAVLFISHCIIVNKMREHFPLSCCGCEVMRDNCDLKIMKPFEPQARIMQVATARDLEQSHVISIPRDSPRKVPEHARNITRGYIADPSKMKSTGEVLRAYSSGEDSQEEYDKDIDDNKPGRRPRSGAIAQSRDNLPEPSSSVVSIETEKPSKRLRKGKVSESRESIASAAVTVISVGNRREGSVVSVRSGLKSPPPRTIIKMPDIGEPRRFSIDSVRKIFARGPSIFGRNRSKRAKKRQQKKEEDEVEDKNDGEKENNEGDDKDKESSVGGSNVTSPGSQKRDVEDFEQPTSVDTPPQMLRMTVESSDSCSRGSADKSDHGSKTELRDRSREPDPSSVKENSEQEATSRDKSPEPSPSGIATDTLEDSVPETTSVPEAPKRQLTGTETNSPYRIPVPPRSPAYRPKRRPKPQPPKQMNAARASTSEAVTRPIVSPDPRVVASADPGPRNKKHIPPPVVSPRREDSDVFGSGLCIICCDGVADSIFEECSHLACCLQCAGRVIQELWHCPICNCGVKRARRVYFTC